MRRSGVRFGAGAALSLAFAVVLAGNLRAPEARAGAMTPGSIDAFAFQPRIGMPGAFIKVCWDRPDRIPSSLVLGSVIWRSDILAAGAPLRVVGGRDGDTDHCFLDSEASRTVTAFDGVPGGEAGERTTFPDVPGIVPGQRYRYRVAVAFRSGLLDRDFDGQPDDVELMSNLSSASRFVTAIAPPTITGVGGQAPGGAPIADPSAVLVEWQQTPGADSYVLWASPEPSFRRGRRVVLGEVRTIPVDLGGPELVSHVVDLRQRRLLRAGRVFLAVGARASTDRKRPQPFGAIFSAPVAVTLEPEPPPAP